MQHNFQKIICVCGNDGTGKSTIVRMLNQNYHQFLALERSTKTQDQSLISIISHIKLIDKLTYRYAFQKQRSNHELIREYQNQRGQKIKIYWIMINASSKTSLQRVKNRDDLSIFQSKKCVQFFAHTYLDMAHYYGMPIIENDIGDKLQEVLLKIIELVESDQANQSIRSLGLKYLNYQTLNQNDIQRLLEQNLKIQQAQLIYKVVKKKLEVQESALYSLFYPQVENFQNEQKFKIKIAIRQLIRQGIFNEQYDRIYYTIENQVLQFPVPKRPYLFYLANEGQSKYIYKILTSIPSIQAHFHNKVIILLKSTIYSHRMQHTGQIKDLGKVRAFGSMLFLEMLRRNSVKHAYICLNQLGIIVSEEVQPNMLEIVFKCKCIGTDKHSYIHMNQQKIQKNNKITLPRTKVSSKSSSFETKINPIVKSQNQNYSNCIYIRYDWRNPNFIIPSNQNVSINSSIFYYPIEKYMTKEIFFQKILKTKCKPIGDKCITPALVAGYVNEKLVNTITLQLYCTLSYYLSQVGLQLIDGCIMIDQKGTIWSQINPDCMRVKSIQEKTQYDKDIWRKGGSHAKQQIIQKWTLFNKIVSENFLKKRFHETQMWEIGRYPYQITAKKLVQQSENSPYLLILHQFIRGSRKRQFIATIDLSKGCPKLVKSSEISEGHHQQDIQKCFEELSVVNKVVMVDLDGAIFQKQDFPRINQQKIYQLHKRQRSNLYAVGGGIRSNEVVNFYKKIGIKRLIYSTNLQLISNDPSIEPIVELSINQENQILTHGRSVNTHINIFDKMVELSKANVKIISITIVSSQGRLQGINRKQLSELLVRVPGKIQKVIIAGGITTIDDLQFLWGFEKCVPQLGAAIWKKTIDLGQLLCKIIQFKQISICSNRSILICPAIIQKNGQVLGQIYLNQQAIIKTVEQRRLWRYSRKQNKLMLKGETSNNILKVNWIRVDCDNDCLLIGVQEQVNIFSFQKEDAKKFCHENRNSCFEACEDISLLDIQEHIFSKIKAGGYSSKIQQYPGRAYLKVIQQAWEMYYAQNKIHKIHECTDMLAHTLMYLNSQRINISQILMELKTRTYKSSQLSIMRMPENTQLIQIGIVSGKHHNYCDLFILQMLGIKIIRPKNRDFKLQFQIVDQSKFEKYFQNKRIQLLGIKSKDMSTVMVKRKINFAINYTIMMDNLPQVSQCIVKMHFDQIKLGLMRKKSQIINPLSWTQSKKGIIASQYPLSTTKYFLSLGINERCFTVMRVSGCSQSYIRVHGFDYCDAIVVTGKTIEDNELEIEAILQSSICIGLYKSF